MRRLYLLSFFSIMCFLLLCSFQSASAQKFGKVQNSEWEIGAPVGFEEANAVILFDKATIKISPDYIEIDYHRRIKVLNSAGVKDIGDISIEYDEDYEKLMGFKAHTILPGGKKHKVKKDAIFEKKVDDFVTKTFSFPQVVPGCIVEYKYSIKTKNFWYARPWYFQGELYTYKSTFSVELWPGFSYAPTYNAVPFDKQEPTIKERSDPGITMGSRFIKCFTWKLEKLLPVTDEPYMSCINDYRASIRFQLISYTNPYGTVHMYVKNWSDVGYDFAKYFDDYCNQNKEVKKLAERLTAGITDEREKSIALYNYVRDKIKSADKLGRWFSHKKMKKMFETGFDSPEAKNLLIAELHKAIGLKAWPVLIKTRKKGKFDASFASGQQFNTLVTFVQIGNTWEFLNASNTFSPYGVLPPQCLTEGGLLIDGKNSELVRITIQPTGSYRTDMTKMIVHADGNVTCTTKCEFGGYYASNYGKKYHEDSHSDFVEKYYKDRLEYTCKFGKATCKLDESNHFVVNLNYTSSDMIKKLDENIQVTPVKFAYTDNPFDNEKRFFPVDFTYPFTYHNQNEIFFEGSVTDYVLPESVTEQINGASFQRQCVKTDSSVIIISQLKIDTAEFPPYCYNNIRSMFDKYVRFNSEKVTAIIEE
ncbi:MAG: DUF3857 and transglutaminase domain-containing protein [candidate division Zixibacteria bacterium]|nr:DUF3857 and transglutaminase domain-containing protein [candidate division Zixibacteria bacterium]